MSVIGSNILAGASGQGGDYTIARSLRFRSSASAYLNKTFSSAGNRKTFTQSYWVKRGTLSTSLYLAGNDANASFDYGFVQFNSTDNLIFYSGTGSTQAELVTTQVFRDPSSWYHLVIAVDTTQATAANRVKIYVNGTQITAFSTATYPSQNADLKWNNNTSPTVIGTWSGLRPSGYFDGYLAEVNWIDGQQLTPSSFGETNTKTGVWQPKKYTGSYGTNGLYFPFTDNSALTTSSNVGLGKDFSGNGNYFATNNISITSGVTYDSMTDVPTLTSATAANYCTLNPLNIGSASSLNSANLNFTSTSAAGSVFQSLITATFGVSSGKWYWEAIPTTSGASGTVFGIAKTTQSMSSNPFGSGAGNIYVYIGSTGNKDNGAGATAYGATYTTNDVIGVALDMDAGTITFYKNNTSQGQAFTGISGTYMPFMISNASNDTTAGNFNFGQRPFAYTPPTGFVALNTFNLPTPTIGATATTQAGKYMNTVLWTGNGASTIDVTGVGFQPDFVWAKRRSASDGHGLFDVVRGTNQWLQSNTTGAETTFGGNFGLLAFNSDGFQMGSGSAVNLSGATYVAWNWKANGTGVTNTAGSITSTVSANTSAGFSVVTYTGTGANATVGHGLGVAPSMVIAKSRSNTRGWITYHVSVGNNRKLLLNSTAAQTGTSSIYWNNTTPTSTVFSLGTDGDCNASGENFVAYCFSAIAGYSAFGSYTGNGSADGVFVFTGFRPRFVMFKRTDSTGDWWMFDTARNTFNVMDLTTRANLSDAETQNSATQLDTLSNGFKMRGTGTSFINLSGGTYIYMAFAENPFKYANAR